MHVDKFMDKCVYVKAWALYKPYTWFSKVFLCEQKSGRKEEVNCFQVSPILPIALVGAKSSNLCKWLKSDTKKVTET